MSGTFFRFPSQRFIFKPTLQKEARAVLQIEFQKNTSLILFKCAEHQNEGAFRFGLPLTNVQNNILLLQRSITVIKPAY